MSQIIATNFIEPHLIEEVGQVGLTSSDIAIALGIDERDVIKKIKRNTWTNNNKWKPKLYTVNNNIKSGTYVPQKRGTRYFFTIQGGKAFVAKHNNNVGDAYLQFLFDCEEVALKKVPEMQSLINQLLAKINKTKIETKKALIVTTKTIIRKGLFEPIIEILKETRPIDSLTLAERQQWEFEHRSKIAEGMLKKNNEQLKMAKILPISTITRKQIENSDLKT
jgi:predicted transcriptional regulator